MSSGIVRVLRNFRRVGLKGYIEQMNTIGDTKSGTLKGTDSVGNKYYENDHEDEIYLRTRWVEYKDKYGDMSQVEPGWHFWLGQGINQVPQPTRLQRHAARHAPGPQPYENLTGTNSAYIPFSTVRPKLEMAEWSPRVADRAAAPAKSRTN